MWGVAYLAGRTGACIVHSGKLGRARPGALFAFVGHLDRHSQFGRCRPARPPFWWHFQLCFALRCCNRLLGPFECLTVCAMTSPPTRPRTRPLPLLGADPDLNLALTRIWTLISHRSASFRIQSAA